MDETQGGDESRRRVRRGRAAALLAILAAVAAAGALLARQAGPLELGAPLADRERRCATARTEDACRHLRLYRTTTYDAGACGWERQACRFIDGDGG